MADGGPRVWVNRFFSFVAGGLVVLVTMSLVAVAPVKSRNAELTTRLDDLQNGAARLLSEAKAYLANQSYGNAEQTLLTLMEKQPTSVEAVEGKTLYAEIQATVAMKDQK